MAILKCDICGGTLEINEDEAVAICEYCGTKQSLPKKRIKRSLNITKRIDYFWETLKRKFKSDYILSFVMPKSVCAFGVFTLIFYIYSLIKLSISGVYGNGLYRFLLMFLPFIIPLLIIAKIINNKKIAIILESFCLIGTLVYFCSFPYSVSNEFFLAVAITFVLGIIWMFSVCFTKQVDNKPREKRKWYLPTVSIVFSIVIVVLFDVFAIPYVDYQYTKYVSNRLENIEIGESVWFGKYEQDNDASNGKEIIEWILLDKQDDKVLVISKHALDSKPFNSNGTDASWKTCDLRRWLNNEFLNSAFTENMRALILTTDLTLGKNLKNKNFPKEVTQDKVFLLSIEEADKYFITNEKRRCLPTKYAEASKIQLYGSHIWWWLRSPGGYFRLPTSGKHTKFFKLMGSVNRDWDYSYAATVLPANGEIDDHGHQVDHKRIGVRPAMWIELDKVE